MSCGRYVSTGLGPVSSAVGIFEPVTITRSTSAVPCVGGGEGFCASTAVVIRKLTAIATPVAACGPDRKVSFGAMVVRSLTKKSPFLTGYFLHFKQNKVNTVV